MSANDNIDAEDIFAAMENLAQAQSKYAEVRMYDWYHRQTEAKELEEAWAEFAKLVQKTNAEWKE